MYQSENLSQAAKREVAEETGLTGLTFKGIHSFRESHMHVFGKSNLFFLCLLEANEIASNTILNPCPREIEEARWMTATEFKDIPSWPLYQEMNLSALRMLHQYYSKLESHRRSVWLKEQTFPARHGKAKSETLFAPDKESSA